MRARLTPLYLPFAAALGLGCGGLVVFEDDPGTGGSGGSGGAPNPTTSSPQQNSATTSSTDDVVSSSSGPVDPCLGSFCGQQCFVCNDFECLDGWCDELGSCLPDPPPCAIHTPCYSPAAGRPCAAPPQAGFALCADCRLNKGCSFAGEILGGPFMGPDGECCYEVAGDCVANP